MAENDQSQEKTQEPTQRRLEKAREDGDVLSSKEMFVFTGRTFEYLGNIKMSSKVKASLIVPI